MILSIQESAAAKKLLALFEVSDASPNLLHYGEGIVLESRRGDSPVILKMIPSHSADTRALQARLDWIRYLHENGMIVPELLESSQGRWIELVDIESTIYVAYAYSKIILDEGSQIDWNDPALPPRLGRVMGRMHRLSKTYQPEPGQPALGQWNDGSWIQNPHAAFHPSQAAVIQVLARLCERISQFPQDQKRCGIIHDDLHTGNVYCLDGDLAILDFDMCHHGWFAADLASALLFRVWIAPQKERLTKEAVVFLKGVLNGYRAENELPQDWPQMLPSFLKLREISLFWSDYGQIDFSLGVSDELFRYLWESIVLEKPFLNIDFTTLHLEA